MRFTREQIVRRSALYGTSFFDRLKKIASVESSGDLEVPSGAYAILCRELLGEKPNGLGDRIERLAKPIARALRLSCLDKQTGALKPESPCGKRRDALNKRFPGKN